MQDVFNLKSKTILVTGASSGIGKAIAIECANRGASIVLVGRNVDRLTNVFQSLSGENHKMFGCDICNDDEVFNMIQAMPQIDGFVNSAGINDKSLIKTITHDKINKMFDINVFGPILLVQKILKEKKMKSNGAMVFISSISSTYATISNALYASSKGAIDSFVKVLALEVSSRRIRVNAIRPGAVETPLLDSYPLKEELDEFRRQYPLGRFGFPEEIAYGVIYLLSDASQWVTGTIFNIDGGITLR